MSTLDSIFFYQHIGVQKLKYNFVGTILPIIV